jgi:ribonucleotide reductase alpha subunit
LTPMHSGLWDFDKLRHKTVKHGWANSLLVGYMPTVSTSAILGNNESFEPIHAVCYTQDTLNGKVTRYNPHFVNHMHSLGLWGRTLENELLRTSGDISEIKMIPADIREIYRSVYDISQSELMRRAQLRGAYIDQSQSLNIHLRDNSDETLRSVFILGNQLRLKTINYYIRTRPAAKPLGNVSTKVNQAKDLSVEVCRRDDPSCESCSG